MEVDTGTSLVRPPKPTILIVDDEHPVRMSIRWIIEVHFPDTFSVHDAGSVEEAVAVARRHQLAIAILDIRMYGGETGFALPPILREQNKNTSIIIHSSHDDQESLMNVLDAEAMYVRKGPDPAPLVEAIRKAQAKHLTAQRTAEESVRLGEMESRSDLSRTINDRCQTATSTDELLGTCAEAFAAWIGHRAVIYDANNGSFMLGSRQVALPDAFATGTDPTGVIYRTVRDTELHISLWDAAVCKCAFYRPTNMRRGLLLTFSGMDGFADHERVQFVKGIFGTVALAAERLMAIEQATRAERMSWLSQMAASIAHETSGPLTTVRNFLIAVKSKDVEWLRSRADQEIRNLDLVARTTRDLMDLYAQGEPRIETVDLNMLVLAVSKSLPSNTPPDVVLLQAAPAPAYAETNPQIIERILKVFTQNAVDATRSISNAKVTIEVSPNHADQGATITVTDNGPGLTDANVRHIFDRVGLTTKKDGHGLGLALSQMLAGRIGCSLRAEGKSEAGGAAFVIALPLPGARARGKLC